MSQNDKGEKGFSLLEVLVALSIVTMILFLSFDINSRSITLERTIRDRLTATYQAEKILDKYIETFPDKGTVTGEVENGGTTYSYRVEVSETPHPDAEEVTVTLSWGESGNPSSLGLTGLAYR